MGENTSTPIFTVLLMCVAASVALAAIGIWLNRSRRLTSSRAGLVWAILSILPLFGAGFAMMTTHVVEQATGVTKSGVNSPPPTR